MVMGAVQEPIEARIAEEVYFLLSAIFPYGLSGCISHFSSAVWLYGVIEVSWVDLSLQNFVERRF